MKTYTYKARGIGGVPTADLLIEATEEIPYYHVVGDWRRLIESEAIKIVDALYASLPGGVLHHVFAEMAKRRASELAVKL